MNKAIQYREDGKFYGLVNVPEKENYVHSWRSGDQTYNNALKSCMAAGKEIINPEVLPEINISESGFVTHRPSKGARILNQIKPGDIFPCPENIEFEDAIIYKCENKNCTIPNRCYQQGKPTLCEQISETVIRLKLKHEVKKKSLSLIGSEILNELDEVNLVESQDELKYNDGQCKVNCNCIEIERIKIGGEIKNYPCLKQYNAKSTKSNDTVRQYNTDVFDELKIRSQSNVYAFEKDYFDGAHDLFIILRNKGLLKI